MIETSSGLLRKSLVIFRNFRKMLGNVRVTFRQVLENFQNLRKLGGKAANSEINEGCYFHAYIPHG